ncbi:MAG TPA: sugar phosphate isomerase/epimerase family protein [Pirellulales bacterium]|nr:sugar phosphate isomerase/epimerase family protein [Pirellulales bacterium]
MIPTLFSVSYAGYWGQHALDLIPFLRKAAALGYRAVEIGGKRPHLAPLDYRDRAKLDAVREEAARWNLEIATIAGYTDFAAGRATADIPLVEMQIAYVDDLARMAALLGAKIVRVFSGYSPVTEHYQSDWRKCVDALRQAADRAAEHGVTLGLQNHHDIGIAVEAYEELLGEVNHPNLKAMFDPWSVALTGGDLRSAAERLAPRMVQTTLADYVRQERFAYDPAIVNYRRLDPPALRAVPLGEGFLDLPAFFAGLRAGGFTGYVAYEMCSPLRGGGSEANLDSAATKSLAHIKRLIG